MLCPASSMERFSNMRNLLASFVEFPPLFILEF
jgi:hypothetical protein